MTERASIARQATSEVRVIRHPSRGTVSLELPGSMIIDLADLLSFIDWSTMRAATAGDGDEGAAMRLAHVKIREAIRDRIGY